MVSKSEFEILLEIVYTLRNNRYQNDEFSLIYDERGFIKADIGK